MFFGRLVHMSFRGVNPDALDALAGQCTAAAGELDALSDAVSAALAQAGRSSGVPNELRMAAARLREQVGPMRTRTTIIRIANRLGLPPILVLPLLGLGPEDAPAGPPS